MPNWRVLLMAAVIAPVSFLAQARAEGAGPAADLGTHGSEVFQAHCAMCHEHPQGRTPGRSILRQSRSPEYILRALTSGVMRQQGSTLSSDDMKAVATYLIGRPPGAAAEVDINANHCRSPGPPMTVDGPAWNGWGRDVTNARYQPHSDLKAADVPKLKVKWAFAYPGGVSNEPAIVGGRVFVSSMAGVAFSLDAKTGCTYWAVDVGVPSRAMISVGKMPSGKYAAYVTDWHGQVHALDAETGAELWKTRVDDHPAVRLTGSPTLFEGRLYVPASSGEEPATPDPNYVCCTFRGSLTALDTATGKIVWKTYTIDQAPGPIPGDSHRMGPAGAGTWSAPTIDAKRRLIYITTGDAYTELAGDASDAIMALDLNTGKKRWTSQVTPGDVFVNGCADGNHNVNCPKVALGPDFDFGSSAVLTTTPGGKDRLIATSKGGVVYGLDLEHRGKILWRNKLGRGGLYGGVEWGGASDGLRVYVPMADTANVGEDATPPPGDANTGLNALSLETGKVLWHSTPKADCAWTGPCFDAHSGAPAIIPGVVFAGSWDGHERAFSARDGHVLWDVNTGHAFDAVNGGKADGGIVDHGSQSIAGGTLFVNSGGRFGHPGNALLAFTVDGK